ncbi:hypothetical protein BD779DRAFT_1690909 [Infundibulicybe gibba]|nr:hypothetical protein BD779DRAFT_1690909 [Infundibulicybe gibba]
MASKTLILIPLGVPFRSPVTVAPNFAANVIFSNLTTPRGIAFDASQNLLVVERGFGVTAFTRVSTPSAGWERKVVGIQVDGNKLYVSSATAALVYSYDAATKTVASTTPYAIVDGIPGDGELTTHTLQLEYDSTGVAVALLIASGPKTNIDPTARDPASGRSQIRRFVFPTIAITIFPPPAIPWSSGQVIAFGIRNPAGFAFSPLPSITPVSTRSLYVVENGASIDGLVNFTAAFVNDNPADELELVTYSTASPSLTAAPPFFGFPDCTTLWNPNADPVGVPQYAGLTRGAQFSLQLDATRNDAWCRAHSVPLDIKFYNAPIASSITSLPATLNNHAFVSFHGSFDRTPPTGYGVVQFQPGGSIISTSLGYSFVVQATNLNTCPGTCIRPVGLAFSADGKLYVSSDSSGELFVIQRSPLTPAPTAGPIPTPTS